MTTPQLQDEICIDKEYVGISPPHNAHLPSVHELLDLCPRENRRGSFALPSELPVFWVKYGRGMFWNEVVAQDMAYHELRRLGSSVRAPAVFYAFKYDYKIYFVMEYIPGNTAEKSLKEAKSQAEKERVMNQVALSLSELHRIPITSGSRPAAADGGLVRHMIFHLEKAPRHYEDVGQLENHLNEFLKGTKSVHRVTNLSLEPMVFCQSDLYPDNFMIDDTGHAVVINLFDASILPSSFARCSLQSNRFGFNICEQVWVPTTDGVDNSRVLSAVSGRMTTGYAFLASLGRRLPGGDKETQSRLEGHN